MVESVVCPSCGRRSKVEADLLGQEGRCARCGTVFTLAVPEPKLGRDGRIKLKCPSCGTRYRLRPELAGRKVMCTSCRFRIPVPGRRTEGQGTVATNRESPSSATDGHRNLARLLEDEDEGESIADIEPGRSTYVTARGRASPERPARRWPRVGDRTWKWWYFLVAGALLLAYSVWQLLEGEPILQIGGRRRGPIGGLILGTLSILIGLWSRPSREDPS